MAIGVGWSDFGCLAQEGGDYTGRRRLPMYRGCHAKLVQARNVATLPACGGSEGSNGKLRRAVDPR